MSGERKAFRERKISLSQSPHLAAGISNWMLSMMGFAVAGGAKITEGKRVVVTCGIGRDWTREKDGWETSIFAQLNGDEFICGEDAENIAGIIWDIARALHLPAHVMRRERCLVSPTTLEGGELALRVSLSMRVEDGDFAPDMGGGAGDVKNIAAQAIRTAMAERVT